MADNSATARALYEAWEKRDFAALAAHCAEEVEICDAARGQVVKGRNNVRDFYASWAAACPDSVCGATIVASSHDTVAIEGVWVGTNTGSFAGLPATGQPVSMPWANVLHFDHDGRIISGTAYYDQLTPMTQLGHLPAPAKA